MSELIKITNDEAPPRIKCPICGKVQRIDLMMFRNDVSKIMELDCVNCKRKVYLGIFILSHPRLQGLVEAINKVVEAINPSSVI